MASVLLGDINDYIGPSQACVKPMFQTEKARSAKDEDTEKVVSSLPGSHIPVDDKDNHPTTTPTTIERRDHAKRKGSHNRRNRSSARGGHGPSLSLSKSQPLRIEHEDTDADVNVRTRSSEGRPFSTKEEHGGITEEETGEVVKVSVADCLACSGCVTSAETVLLSQHSVPAFLERCQTSSGIHVHESVVVTISSASVADLSRYLFPFSNEPANVSSEPPKPKLIGSYQSVRNAVGTALRRSLGVEAVVDAALCNEVALMESALEFLWRYRRVGPRRGRQHPQGVGQGENTKESSSFEIHKDCASTMKMNKSKVALRATTSTTHYSVAVSATETQWMDASSGAVFVEQHEPGRLHMEDDDDNHDTRDVLPVLTSSCPGFVCYVEKTAPPAVLSHLSTVKSPMSISGALIKHTPWNFGSLPHCDNDGSVSSPRVYHVAVMPCHDKKLEASRLDFAWETMPSSSSSPGESTLQQDVDLVITTEELVSVLYDLAVKEGDKQMDEPKEKIGNPEKKLPSRAERIRMYLEQVMFEENTNTEAMKDSNVIANAHHQPLSSDDDKTAINGGLSIPSFAGKHPVVHDWYDRLLLVNDPTDVAATVAIDDKDVERINFSDRPIGSGGYAEYVFRYAAAQLFGCVLPWSVTLPWRNVGALTTTTTTTKTTSPTGTTNRPVRRQRRRRPTASGSTDFREVCLYRRMTVHPDGSGRTTPTYSLEPPSAEEQETPNVEVEVEVVLRFALAYGFKNVQSVLQHWQGNGDGSSLANCYDYVEVMACPRGCPNGGGQVRDDDSLNASTTTTTTTTPTPSQVRERVARNLTYMGQSFAARRGNTEVVPSPSSSSSPCCPRFPTDDRRTEPPNDTTTERRMVSFGPEARRLFHTRFHRVPKMELTSGATAGVGLHDIQW